MRNCLFTVVPSICYENCPLSLLESMAYGKAVIGSRLGGIPEIINHKYGELFKERDPEDISQQINYLFQNQDYVIQLGQAARQMVEQKFDPQKYYQELILMIKSCLEENGGQARTGCLALAAQNPDKALLLPATVI